MKNKVALLLFACLLFSLMLAAIPAFAEDCLHDPIYDRNWNAEVTTGARVRDIPCMETSAVLTTLPVGEVVRVIAETDGYYKIRRADGTEGWVGQWLISATDKPFVGDAVTNTPREALYDIKGNKYEIAIRWMAEKSIISGYPDGSFKPEGNLNRAELMKIMSLTYSLANPEFDFEAQRASYDVACFSDIEPGKWYTPYVCYGKAMGIVQGFPDGQFKPERAVTKVEALKIVLNSLDMSVALQATDNYFQDTDLNAWYAPYIQFAYFNSIIEEKSGNFLPGNFVGRGMLSNWAYLTYQLGWG